jgi:hypothetical protein
MHSRLAEIGETRRFDGRVGATMGVGVGDLLLIGMKYASRYPGTRRSGREESGYDEPEATEKDKNTLPIGWLEVLGTPALVMEYRVL